MPNPYERSKSIEQAVTPPGRPWLRSAFFKLNFAFASLFAVSCFTTISLAYKSAFLATLAACAILIYAACEAAGLFNRSAVLERGLGIANLVIAVAASIILVVSIAKPSPPNEAADSIVFELVFAALCMGFIVYLFICGFLRVKWTRKSNVTV